LSGTKKGTKNNKNSVAEEEPEVQEEGQKK